MRLMTRMNFEQANAEPAGLYPSLELEVVPSTK
jgi:hypothetical protein